MKFICAKCHGEYPQYIRMKRRKNGKRTISRASFCVLCHREDQRIRDARIYDWKLAYNRKWRRKNKEKVREYKRRDYWKNKKANEENGIPVEWHTTNDDLGFSKLTYVPLYPGPSRRLK